MFYVYASKKNSPDYKEFIIPRNSGYNCTSWISITIKGKEEFLVRRLAGHPEMNESDWELKNYAFPSALLTEFLRLDFFE